MSPGKVAEMKSKIEAEKKALVQKKDMAEEEKNKAAKELEKREEDLIEAEYVDLDLLSLFRPQTNLFADYRI